MEPPTWLDDHGRASIRESVDQIQRYIEELDTTKERTLLIKDDIINQLSETTNCNLYVLSMSGASTAFIPTT